MATKLSIRQQILAGNAEQQEAASRLARPEKATDQQWETYKSELAKFEAQGFPNPGFLVEKPWEKVSSARFRR